MLNYAIATCYLEVPENPTTLSARVNSGLWIGALERWFAYCLPRMVKLISSDLGRSFIPRIREFKGCYGYVQDHRKGCFVKHDVFSHNSGEDFTWISRRLWTINRCCETKLGVSKIWDLKEVVDGYGSDQSGVLGGHMPSQAIWIPSALFPDLHVLCPPSLYIYFIIHDIQNPQDRVQGCSLQKMTDPFRGGCIAKRTGRGLFGAFAARSDEHYHIQMGYDTTSLGGVFCI